MAQCPPKYASGEYDDNLSTGSDHQIGESAKYNCSTADKINFLLWLPSVDLCNFGHNKCKLKEVLRQLLNLVVINVS